MKKILLASTMLVGTTGFAAADVSLSGSAYTGVAYSFANGLMIDHTANLVASMMTTTDGGLEVGATMVLLAAGNNMQKDPTDGQFGFNDYPPFAGLILGSTIYMSGSWGKVTVAYDTSADDSATPSDPDITVTYSNTWGNFGLSAYGTYAPAFSAANTSGDFGVKASYDFGNYGVWAAVDWDNDDADGNKIDLSAGASASFSNFNIAAEVKYDLGTGLDSWSVEAGYATGPYAVSVFVNEDIDYGAKASYDLGGGVKLEAGAARDATLADTIIYAGVSMKF